MKPLAWFSSVTLLLVTSACGDSRKSAPQMIEAGGQSFYACKDTVYIDNKGGGWFGGETLKYGDPQ
jgi:hypothetical protein